MRLKRLGLFIALLILGNLMVCVAVGTSKHGHRISGQEPEPGGRQRVRFVYDGDTVLLDGGYQVRYLGINAPEIDHRGGKSEFMAKAARKFNHELVNGAFVRLEYDKKRRDQHGRVLAYLYLKDGRMVNAILLRKGLAHVMTKRPNFRYRAFFLRCQRTAMKEGLGIWSRSPQNVEEFYLGNQNSLRFHRPSCRFGKRISSGNRVKFKTRYDAFWEGYSPCRRCMP